MNRSIDWKKVWKDTCQIFIQDRTIKDVKTLYERLGKKYKKDNTIENLPSDDYYSRRLRKELDISRKKKNISTELCKFAGLYSELPLEELSKDTSLSSVNSCSDCSWLFIKLTRVITDEYFNKKYTAVQAHLYHLSHKLKENFKNEILFASFDNDTLAVLCKDQPSKEMVENYITTHVNNKSR